MGGNKANNGFVVSELCPDKVQNVKMIRAVTPKSG
jgi:hypothetical protein